MDAPQKNEGKPPPLSKENSRSFCQRRQLLLKPVFRLIVLAKRDSRQQTSKITRNSASRLDAEIDPLIFPPKKEETRLLLPQSKSAETNRRAPPSRCRKGSRKSENQDRWNQSKASFHAATGDKIKPKPTSNKQPAGSAVVTRQAIMKASLITYSFQISPALEIANPSSGEGLLATVKEEN